MRARRTIYDRVDLVNCSLSQIPFNQDGSILSYLSIETSDRQMPEVQEFKRELHSALSHTDANDREVAESRFRELSGLVAKLESQEPERSGGERVCAGCEASTAPPAPRTPSAPPRSASSPHDASGASRPAHAPQQGSFHPATPSLHTSPNTRFHRYTRVSSGNPTPAYLSDATHVRNGKREVSPQHPIGGGVS